MKLLNTLILSCLFVVTLASCVTKEIHIEKASFAPNPVEIGGVFFSVNNVGIPTARNASGNKLPLKEAETPFSIKGAKTINKFIQRPRFSLIEIIGSRYVLICGSVCRVYYFP